MWYYMCNVDRFSEMYVIMVVVDWLELRQFPEVELLWKDQLRHVEMYGCGTQWEHGQHHSYKHCR